MIASRRRLGGLVLSVVAVAGGAAMSAAQTPQPRSPEIAERQVQLGGRVFVADGTPGQMRTMMVGGMPHLLRPDVARRDMAIIAGDLNLDTAQRAILELLVDEYVENFTQKAAKLRDALRTHERQAFAGGPFLGGPDMADMHGAIAQAMRAAAPGEGGAIEEDVFIEGGQGVRVIRISDGPPPEGIARAMQRAAEGGAAPEQHVEVHVMVAGPEGEPQELPEAVKQRIQEIKARLHERMKELAEKIAAEHAARPTAPADAPAAPAEAQPEQPPAMTTAQIVAAARELMAEKTRLQDQFASDLAMALTDEQAARWPEVQRKLRRATTLPRSELSGEQVDLVRLINQRLPELREDPEVAAALAEYEIAMEEALRHRNDSLVRTDPELFEATDAMDGQKRQHLEERRMHARLAVRNVNDAFINAIASSLDDDAAERFRALAEEEAFARVHRPTITQRSFAAALKLPDLEPATKDAIAALEQAYLSQVRPINQRLMQVMREEESKEPRRRAEFMEKVAAGELTGPPPSPIRDEFARRSQVGLRYLDQLKGMLTPEQAAALPGAGAGAGAGGGFEFDPFGDGRTQVIMRRGDPDR